MPKKSAKNMVGSTIESTLKAGARSRLRSLARVSAQSMRGIGATSSVVAGRDRVALPRVGRGKHDRVSSAGKAPVAAQEGAQALDVLPDGGLVQEDALGVPADRQCEVQALALPAGELLRLYSGLLLEPGHLD